jgi:hypothetical protein
VDDLELVRMTLKGFKEDWTPLIKGSMACEKLSDWSSFWDDFIQEKIQDKELNGS